MSVAVLTVFKLVLLALLYYFVYRVVRAILADLYGPSRKRAPAPPRPAVASSSPRRSGRPPREIVVHPPEGRPVVIELDRDSVTLGRSQRMTVALDDVYVSDEHALISPNDDGWVVRDLGSTNGTYINGAKVTQPTPIAAGDQLRIGKTRIEVRR
jgi:pSer/pThr/pTyr-binding forkhead associated (FHA) protein